MISVNTLCHQISGKPFAVDLFLGDSISRSGLTGHCIIPIVEDNCLSFANEFNNCIAVGITEIQEIYQQKDKYIITGDRCRIEVSPA